jgi:ribosome-associated protein
VSPTVAESEVEFSAIRAQGPGGQNVNKVSSAVHLRFDVIKSSLPEPVKQRLLARADQRITEQGVIVIKAQSSRTQERNRAEAMARLQELVDAAAHVPIQRRATRPTLGSKRRRLKDKGVRSEVKAGRSKVAE